MTDESIDARWLDAALRASRTPAIDDDGFSAGVLARIASPSPSLSPRVALAALHEAERVERRNARWTIGGVMLGAAFAAAAAWLAGGQEGFAMATTVGADVSALLLVSCSLAWLAIAGERNAAAW